MKNRRDLLLLDDDKEILAILSKLASEAGFTFVASNSIDDAKQQLEQFEFFAILSDMRMPEATGTQFLAKLRELNVQTPVIFLSAVTDTERVIEAMRYGALDYIFKPFRKDELVAVLRKAIDSGRSTVELS